MITIKIAGIPIGLECRYDYTKEYVKDYITDEEALFTVSASDEDIEREHVISGVRVPDYYAENVVLYRKIAERLPEYDALVFHGAVLECDGVAYAVTAHSGVGKTTHTRLWLSEFEGRVRILNGDKPILRVIDGVITACSTPWMGKEGYGYNATRPLGGIAFLARGAENVSRKISPDKAVMRFMNQVYLSKGDVLALTRSMRIADTLLSGVPLYELECNMQPQAAHVAYDAFVNGITNG
ncbi:MAG: hypothetical protein J6Q69_00280 [Clostridia bacterium]|nr:hypothetical protein [Clostridia bacterium]